LPPEPQENDAQPDEPPPEPVYDEEDVVAANALVPAERRGTIEQTQYLANPSGEIYFAYGALSVRNSTEYANNEMLAAASEAPAYNIELNSDKPQVLIVHTHSTESFDRFDAGFYDSEYPTRSTDSERNIVAVGEALTQKLNALGINTVHASEYHDYPSYNNAYSRSAETIKSYLAQYPSITVVLDVHRDGIQREDGTRLKPTAIIDGEKAAQIMIVCGAGDETDAVPGFRENLKFAARLGDSAERLHPGLVRPVLFTYRHYNQDLTNASLLLEVGSESNTLGEAKRAAQLFADALFETLSAPQSR
ncbi:MAG: stage II sporulation protein P, partial [Oscillospiraceae bacterium]